MADRVLSAEVDAGSAREGASRRGVGAEHDRNAIGHGPGCCEPPALLLPGLPAQAAPAAAHGRPGERCCSKGVPVFDGVDPRYRRILWTVIGLNGAMSLGEMAAARLAESQALQADALDFLADTVTYGLPKAEVMGAVGVLAPAVNAASVRLLRPDKDGDADVCPVWLCSRNDAVGNVIVMVAALAVWGTATAWPDLLVAAIMAGLFLTSSVQILRQAWSKYGHGRDDADALAGI